VLSRCSSGVALRQRIELDVDAAESRVSLVQLDNLVREGELTVVRCSRLVENAKLTHAACQQTIDTLVQQQWLSYGVRRGLVGGGPARDPDCSNSAPCV